MSIQAGTPTATAATTAGEPVVNQALEPAWVRHGSQSTQKAYESALSFEQTLVEQLSKSLADTSGLGGESEGESGSEEGSSSSDAGASQIASMLPQALSAGVMNAGGLGMAAQMTRELEGVQATTKTHADGGTSAA
jgi:Rod binding domain-containing protein